MKMSILYKINKILISLIFLNKQYYMLKIDSNMNQEYKIVEHMLEVYYI